MYQIIITFIVLACVLVWYLLKHDHGRRLPVTSLWIACGFGVLGIIAAMLLELNLLPKDFAVSPLSIPIAKRFTFFMSVGFLEEAAKFIPLALFIYKKSYFKEHTDGVIFFAICGLTFGLFENIMYTVSYGSNVGIARLIMTPFFHAASTSILGYYLVNMKINKANKTKFVLACLLLPVMHGFYDFGLGSGLAVLAIFSLMITLLLTIGLFLYFMAANDLDKAAVASIPINSLNYCKFCGKPNANHKMFCEYCGRHI